MAKYLQTNDYRYIIIYCCCRDARLSYADISLTCSLSSSLVVPWFTRQWWYSAVVVWCPSVWCTFYYIFGSYRRFGIITLFYKTLSTAFHAMWYLVVYEYVAHSSNHTAVDWMNQNCGETHTRASFFIIIVTSLCCVPFCCCFNGAPSTSMYSVRTSLHRIHWHSQTTHISIYRYR